MAIITNTYLTFDAKGNREQLANVIYSISPEFTPLVSRMAKENTRGTLFEWQTDELAQPNLSNAVVQGDDVTSFAAISPTVRVGNYTQISRKEMVISETQKAVDSAGRDDEVAYQTMKRGKELRRDIENMIFQYTGGGVAGNATTAPRTAGLLAWVKTNDVFGAGGASPVYTSGVPGAGRTDGSLTAFDETKLKSVIQLGYTSGSDIDGMTLYLGPVNKAKASSFPGVATKNFDISGTPRATAIIGSADVYVSEFGVLSLEPSRWQRERDVWGIDHSFLALVHLRPFAREPLAKTGDAEKLMLIQEWGFKPRNEAALLLAADNTTT